MKTRYNIYFEGQLLADQDPAQVRANLGKLFNADEQTLDRLFSGSRQRLKKDCDEETARKYKVAMERAGAVAIVAALGDDGDSATDPGAEQTASAAASTNVDSAAAAPPAEASSTEKKQSAAERIAALAAAKADPRFGSADDEEDTTPKEVEWASPLDSEGNLALTPPGTEVLLEEERPEAVVASIDTSALQVDSAAERLSEEQPAPPPAPDTSHMEMGNVGDAIPTIARTQTALNPDTSGIDLSPEGTDFSDCAAPEATPPELDLSAIKVAPEGSDVLEEQYRKKDTAEAPATDHLSVQH